MDLPNLSDGRPRLSLTEQIRHQLLDQILRRKIGPKLSEATLAKQFGTSKTPIREALNRLTQQNIVTPVPRLGWWVRRPSWREIRDLLAVRVVLESLAAAEAAKRITPKELDELAQLAEATFDPDDLDSHNEFIWINYNFHMSIARISRNAILESHLRMILERLQLVLVEEYMFTEASAITADHQRLVACLRNRDPAASRAEAEAQIGATLGRLAQLPETVYGKFD